jgi:hypothetical protein
VSSRPASGAGNRDAGDAPAGRVAPGTAGRGSASRDGRSRGALRLPPVRLAPREELAAAARVAPLLRTARDLARWQHRRAQRGSPAGQAIEAAPDSGAALPPEQAAAAAADLDLSPADVDAAWRVAAATGMLGSDSRLEAELSQAGARSSEDAGLVLTAWDTALGAVLAAEELDGLATALYTVGEPVRMEALFDAYAAAAGAGRSRPGPDQMAALSQVLEILADLGVVELGTEDPGAGDTDDYGAGLTVTLSPLGVWGVHRRLRAQGWHVPVLAGADRSSAQALLAVLASCDVEDGEAEISSWLAARTPAGAAAELVRAAGSGSPGLRGAAFAVLDRIGEDALAEVRAAVADPVLRAHAAVWLNEHGEPVELRPEDRTWLLVDLGAGLLEEADPEDVVAELLPEMPADAQAEVVASLWQVEHPAVTDLLTALSEHHPDPGVARAARKAAFKARSASARTQPQAP